jgi:hypothetical protein
MVCIFPTLAVVLMRRLTDRPEAAKPCGPSNSEAISGYRPIARSQNQRRLSSSLMRCAHEALASELFAKLTAAKSIPDAASACQQWGSRQMEILAEQNRRVMATSERIAPQLFGNGFKGGST